uniref:Carbamoyltransferase n=1 Tax=Chlorobium chlorochromatii (strain CaD3) TaxID=340177 RepID=Q3AT69_CHLCH
MQRQRLLINGIVQGVGFRPFVYRLAIEHELTGFIRNTALGVLIEVQGSADRLDSFCTALHHQPPPLARIASFEMHFIPCVFEEATFVITDSHSGGDVETLIPPDIALCSDCRRELYDPTNRRYRYPFINCTNCGPRYTIVAHLPYDRPTTSMQSFAICPECEQEYHNPLDRRFHAEPTCCPICGPSLSLLDADGNAIADDPLEETASLLHHGAIVAIKGIGGFHVAVDALNDDAVLRLRKSKGREAKPFAVMMRDVAVVERYCMVNDDERQALLSAEAPIVLLKKLANTQLAASVAPDNDRLGVMLPYTPLHLLLFDRVPEVLVMTSANMSEEPMVHENSEALQKLQGIADAFLMHNRPIYLKCDDSVTIHLAGQLRQLRRSRGYVPAPLLLRHSGATLLATGGELKNSVTLLKAHHAIMSQHIGDVKNFDAYCHFEQVVAHLQHLFQATPELIVHDLHPAYLTTQWAEKQAIPTLGVQHHHAHLAACLAENQVDEPAIGVILDGTGYGTDGTVWGGEVLIGDVANFERFASLELMPLAGGEAAIRQPWRAAVGYIYKSCGSLPDLPFLQNRDIAPIMELLERQLHLVETSSCGRLFDVVAALCNLRGTITYEGEAAIALMHAANGTVGRQPFPYDLCYQLNRWIIGIAPMIRSIVNSLLHGASAQEVSQRFHGTLVHCFCEVVQKASEATGLKIVALSGGVFQNELLFTALVHALEQAGFTVLTHSRVPTNDGGLSLGQAIIGRRFLA